MQQSRQAQASDSRAGLAAARFFKGCAPECTRRFEFRCYVGRGAYGEVGAAIDLQTKELVAIKKVSGCFSNMTEAKRLLRELRILRHLDDPHVIKIRGLLRPVSLDSFQDLWIVMDYVDLDMRKLIVSPQTITLQHVQWIARQTLAALSHIHAAHVLHRDLKPANVLLNGSCDVKICDFGLSRVVNESGVFSPPEPVDPSANLSPEVSQPVLITRQLTSHVVTRWYRAPELILMQRYTAAIDVWSVGCIMAELLTMLPESGCKPHERSALFPGSSCFPLSPSGEDLQLSAPYDQLSTIVRVIGTSQGDLGWIENEELREYLRAMPHVERTPLASMYPGASEEAVDLLEWMLAFNPSERCTVQQALEHPFFHGMPELIVGCRPTVPNTTDFEESDLSPQQLRHLILDEINSYQRYEVEMQRRPSLISDGRGPSLLGIAPAAPVPPSALGESNESHTTEGPPTEATLANGGSSSQPLASPQPTAQGAQGEKAGGSSKRQTCASSVDRSEPAQAEKGSDGKRTRRASDGEQLQPPPANAAVAAGGADGG
mmetsp:Transcript_13137/g.30861  ORF Transcript_13137/g.30861 Transcript_13137/m.30861 type:complete len:546 (-) Transcript_13137:224-1861(-)